MALVAKRMQFNPRAVVRRKTLTHSCGRHDLTVLADLARPGRTRIHVDTTFADQVPESLGLPANLGRSRRVIRHKQFFVDDTDREWPYWKRLVESLTE